MNLMNNGQWIVVMKIQPSICLMIEENHEKTCKVDRHRDLNPGPPECESRVLPWSHLSRFILFLLSKKT